MIKISRNKFVFKVWEGDVRNNEIGFDEKRLKALNIFSYDPVIVYKIGEKKPYLLRNIYRAVKLHEKTHYSYNKALKGFAILSSEAMEKLDLERKDEIIVDPYTPKLPLEEYFMKFFLQSAHRVGNYPSREI